MVSFAILIINSLCVIRIYLHGRKPNVSIAISEELSESRVDNAVTKLAIIISNV